MTYHDPAPPDVSLITGRDDWTVIGTNAAGTAPDDLAQLTTANANFTVSLSAANVDTIHLTPTGNFYGSLVDSTISGDLTGDLTLQANSAANGGDLSLTINGDVVSGASITAPDVEGLTMGELAGTLNLQKRAGAQQL